MEEGGAAGVGLPVGGDTVPVSFLSVPLFSDSLKNRLQINQPECSPSFILDKIIHLNVIHVTLN